MVVPQNKCIHPSIYPMTTTPPIDEFPSKEETDEMLQRLRATLSPEQQKNFDKDMAAIHERMNEYTMKHIVK
jgi:thioredoxin-like negative regulator of GroEL